MDFGVRLNLSNTRARRGGTPGSITKAKNERTKDTVVDKNPTAVVYPSDRLPAHVVKHFGHAQPHEGPDGVA